jgi:hypothetical protein
LRIPFQPVYAQYDITLKAFEELMPNSTVATFSKLKVKRFGRNEPHVIVGEFTFHQEIGDEIEFLGGFFKKQGEEYRRTPYKVKGRLCEALRMEDLLVPQIWHYLDLPLPKEQVNLNFSNFYVIRK